MKLITIICIIFSFKTIKAEDCFNTEIKLKNNLHELDKLSENVEKIVKKNFVKVADLKVNHAGSGDLSLLIDENSKVIAVKFHYVDGSEVKDITVSIEEFNQGKGINYPAFKGGVSPLKLNAVIPPGIGNTTGGEFNLVIGTKISPAEYSKKTIKISVKNGEWSLLENEKKIKKVTLSPGISWASWDGTFQEAKFE